MQPTGMQAAKSDHEKVLTGRMHWGHKDLEQHSDEALLAEIDRVRLVQAKKRAELSNYTRPEISRDTKTLTEKGMEAVIRTNSDYITYLKAILRLRGVKIPPKP